MDDTQSFRTGAGLSVASVRPVGLKEDARDGASSLMPK